MPTYATVTFKIQAEDGMFRPSWEKEANVTIRHIPGASYDDVQFNGLGNPTLNVRAILSADADVATLFAALGTTQRTLEDLFSSGDDYANVMLTNIANLRRWDYGVTWLCDLTFVQDGGA